MDRPLPVRPLPKLCAHDWYASGETFVVTKAESLMDQDHTFYDYRCHGCASLYSMLESDHFRWQKRYGGKK